MPQHNSVNFFKDRHWLDREFGEIGEAVTQNVMLSSHYPFFCFFALPLSCVAHRARDVPLHSLCIYATFTNRNTLSVPRHCCRGSAQQCLLSAAAVWEMHSFRSSPRIAHSSPTRATSRHGLCSTCAITLVRLSIRCLPRQCTNSTERCTGWAALNLWIRLHKNRVL
eukprot:SAG11_NODE_853_length_6874_cov_1.980074_2_plen_167_part_00